ncbi:MAG TPA: hypothetical protein VF247_07185 [Candidatus Krumholzibacteria bacterium]
MKCDHSDGTHVGSCAVCGEPVCTECFQALFNVNICANHEGLEDEGEWELVALYMSTDGSDGLRFHLDDHGVQSLAVENEDGIMEVYVPIEEKDEAWASLEGGEAGDDMIKCDEDRLYFAREIGECPICGTGAES